MKLLKIFLTVVLTLTENVLSKSLLQNLNNQAFAIVGQKNVLSRHSRSVESVIAGMQVTSVIRSRFAKVTTVSDMLNTHGEAKEITFSARLPDAAFITEFTMIVDGVTFVGKVKEKALAREQYEAAQKKGNPAGLVTANVRETQTFNVAANVPAYSSVTFTLVYQELLKRRVQKYEQQIFINPGQLVDDFTVTVYITEQSGITMLAAKHPEYKSNDGKSVANGFDLNGKVPIETDVRRSKYQAKVVFKPTPSQQRRLLMIPENDRKVSVIYDVAREVLGGELQTRNGYFVHFFAPENLPILPKKFVFVIDRSGSMSGRKMEQTKEAFATVLRDLSEADEFNIVSFFDYPMVWMPDQMVPATSENVELAIEYVQAMYVYGGTNLNDAALEAAHLLRFVRRHHRVAAAVVILTDGEPTTGVTDESQIRLNVKRAVRGRFSVFCLGFGEYLNHDFLKKLSTENDGIARKIYEDSDADLQLEGFFQEVASPLLSNVRVSYQGAIFSNVSETNFDKYFDGSEIIVTGAVDTVFDRSFRSSVNGVSDTGHVRYSVQSKAVDEDFQHWYEDVGDFNNFIERMWAYYTIKGLMEKKTVADSEEEVRNSIDRAMRLSMKYGFVTPLTSMVVVLPEDERTTPSSFLLCFASEEVIPEDITEPPISCPYIFDDVQRTMDQSEYSVDYDTYNMQIGPECGLGCAWDYSMALDPMEVNAEQNVLQNPVSCGGNLTSESGRIMSLGDLGTGQILHCEWKVELPEGAWIDLFIEKLSTISNEVKITDKNDNVLLHHTSGDAPAGIMYVTDNKIKIEIINIPGEEIAGIVISYQKFVPDSPNEVEGNNTEDSSAPSNCGHRISSNEQSLGFVVSPNYPHTYPSNANCVWTIVNEAPDAFQLLITILDMDIEMNESGECVHDKFTIASGGNVQTRCGFTVGDTFVIDEETATLTFSSDNELETSGFKVKFKFAPKVYT